MEGGTTSKVQLQKAFIEYANGIKWKKPMFVTLTLKQRVDGRWLQPLDVETNFRHVMNRLNRAAYGNAFDRYGKGCPVIVVHERSTRDRLHTHAQIDCPEHFTIAEFDAAIRHASSKTLWGYQAIETRPVKGDWCIGYLAKFKQKSDLADAIDWNNARS